MELRLEAILETLLVGALASLVILSIIFFLFGHIWDIPVMRRFFDTLFGEREKEDPATATKVVHEAAGEEAVDEEAVRAAYDPPLPPRRPKEEGGEESPPKFSIVLLYALMYGLGVIAEGAAHESRHFDDNGVRRIAFRLVAEGQIRSGTASPRLAQFISDYEACDALLKDLKHRHDAQPTLCEQLDTRVVEFFHNAKNAVFQNEDFYDELSAMEGRINFIRSFYVLTLVLIVELGIVVVIATIAEYGYQKHRYAWRIWAYRVCLKKKWLREWRQPFINLGAHWVHIAALHCLLLLAAAVGIGYLCHEACDYCEDQFSRRVVGYYLALKPERAEGAKPECAEGAKPERAEGAKPAPSDAPAERDLTPRSPYHVFSLPESTCKESDAHNQRRLEPSAFAILGDSARVIVANDHGGGEPFWLFTLNDDTAALENPTPIHIYPDGQQRLRAMTIDGLTVLEPSASDGKGENESACPEIPVGRGDTSDHKIVKILALASTKSPGEEKLLSFCLDLDAKDLEIDHLGVEAMDPPCGKSEAGCTVEGLAWSHTPEALVVGIRAKTSSRIVSFSRARDHALSGWFRSTDTVFDICLDKAMTGIRKSGLALTDLAVTPNGQVYVTTSASPKPPSHDDKEALVDHAPPGGGALWLLDIACDSQQGAMSCACNKPTPTLLETFVHSPSGLTYDEGSVLVLFNDETGHKSRQWAPKTFPLGQDESVFAVVPSAAPK